MPADRSGSGGNGAGFFDEPELRARLDAVHAGRGDTRAPQRLAPTPSPVYPAA